MEKQLLVDGYPLHYRIIGQGRNVLLVHGFGEDGSVWTQQADHLQSSCRLIIPDLPGSGKSPISQDMSMEGLASILRSLVQQEAESAVTIIGHSMGGYITLAFAEKFPELVHAMGLFHSTAFADSDEKIATRKKGIAFIQEHGAYAFLKNTSPNLFSQFTKDERPQLVDRFIGNLSNFLPEALVLYYEAMIARPDRTAVLKSAPYPVLFVMGKYDAAIPMDDMLKLCHMPEKSYIHTLYRSGHMGMLEETEKSNKLLEHFLTEA